MDERFTISINYDTNKRECWDYNKHLTICEACNLLNDLNKQNASLKKENKRLHGKLTFLLKLIEYRTK